MAARVLKIGMHLRFDPKFTVEFEHFDQKYFRQAYCPLWCLIEDALFSSGSNNDAVHFHLSQRVRHACLSILTKNIHHCLPGKKPFNNFLLANLKFFPQKVWIIC